MKQIINKLFFVHTHFQLVLFNIAILLWAAFCAITGKTFKLLPFFSLSKLNHTDRMPVFKSDWLDLPQTSVVLLSQQKSKFLSTIDSLYGKLNLI